MVDLMTVEWVRRGHRATSDEPLAFWNAADVSDQMGFAWTWVDDPQAHFSKFSSANTRGVLAIIRDIAERRNTLTIDGPNGSWASHPLDPAIWNDTLDVVKYSPVHCGGWMGLLHVHLIPARSAAVVVRPDPNNPDEWFITWPPTTDRSLLAIFNWFIQGFQPQPANYDSGDQWVANQRMLAFIRGQKATGGFEQLAKTVAGLAYENASHERLHYYLSHLRSHGPEERGRDHFLFNMVTSRDADAVTVASDLDTFALDYVLKSFPAAWAETEAGHWSAVVVDHINTWRTGMGNHREGLRWLSRTLELHIARWRDLDDMRLSLGGTRETQVTLARTLTQSVTESVTQVQAISTEISLAHRQATTEGWSRALTESLARIDSWQRRTSGGTSSTTDATFGNSTAVTLGGETGTLEDFLLGKISGEVTTTIQNQLRSQFTTHLEHERTSGGSTTSTRAHTTTQTLERMREVSYQMARTASESLTQTVQRGRSIGQSVQAVQSIAGSLDSQIVNVRQGLEGGKRYVDRALGGA